MAGIFGVVSKEDCVEDLFLGTHYLQHRAQDYCGLALSDGKNFEVHTGRGLIKQKFPKERLDTLKGNFGIGSVSTERQPVSEFSQFGGLMIIYDGNLINYQEVIDDLLKAGGSFSGYRDPKDVKDIALISKIIAMEPDFVSGIKKLVEVMKGDFSIIALNKDKIYAARGWGRKPLILGQKENSYAVSSESNSFVNIGMNIVRDVEPGEIVLLDEGGIHSLGKLDLGPVKYGTFEWIYTAYPASVIEGRNVAQVRKRVGELLAKEYPVEVDLISPVPNSGRWHAIGYSKESKIPYEEVFIRYDYSDRSYTPKAQSLRNEEARTKLIPIKDLVEGKKIVLVDDSIVRGTQTLNQVKKLRALGVKEIHLRVACPPLMCACKYGDTTKKDEDCIARRISIDEIRKILGVDSLKYATVEILEQAIGIPRDKLCLACWGVLN